jgi:hypothetical protein
MIINRSVAIVLVTFCFSGWAESAPLILKVGDCWSYHTRPGAESSYLIIQKTEMLPKVGQVAHITVCGIKLRTPKLGYADHIDDIPIVIGNLQNSVTTKKNRCGCESDWIAGYQTWRKAYDAGKINAHPAYSLSVRECVSLVEQTLNQ